MGLDVPNHIFRLFVSGGIHNYNDWTFENILKRKEISENQLLGMSEAKQSVIKSRN
jgi:hypothetical protein